MADCVDAGAVAKSHEQRLSAEPCQRGLGLLVGEHAVWGNLEFRGDESRQAAPDGVREELFDELLHFGRADVNEVVAHECVGCSPVGRRELLEPVGETLDESHARAEIAVAVVLEARHQFQPGELLACEVVGPRHDLRENP